MKQAILAFCTPLLAFAFIGGDANAGSVLKVLCKENQNQGCLVGLNSCQKALRNVDPQTQEKTGLLDQLDALVAKKIDGYYHGKELNLFVSDSAEMSRPFPTPICNLMEGELTEPKHPASFSSCGRPVSIRSDREGSGTLEAGYFRGVFIAALQCHKVKMQKEIEATLSVDVQNCDMGAQDIAQIASLSQAATAKTGYMCGQTETEFLKYCRPEKVPTNDIVGSTKHRMAVCYLHNAQSSMEAAIAHIAFCELSYRATKAHLKAVLEIRTRYDNEVVNRCTDEAQDRTCRNRFGILRRSCAEARWQSCYRRRLPAVLNKETIQRYFPLNGDCQASSNGTQGFGVLPVFGFLAALPGKRKRRSRVVSRRKLSGTYRLLFVLLLLVLYPGCNGGSGPTLYCKDAYGVPILERETAQKCCTGLFLQDSDSDNEACPIKGPGNEEEMGALVGQIGQEISGAEGAVNEARLLIGDANAMQIGDAATAGSSTGRAGSGSSAGTGSGGDAQNPGNSKAVMQTALASGSQTALDRAALEKSKQGSPLSNRPRDPMPRNGGGSGGGMANGSGQSAQESELASAQSSATGPATQGANAGGEQGASPWVSSGAYSSAGGGAGGAGMGASGGDSGGAMGRMGSSAVKISGESNGSLDYAAVEGASAAGDSSGVTDPSDYFSYIAPDESLFKVVERKYREKSRAWALSEARKLSSAKDSNARVSEIASPSAK